MSQFTAGVALPCSGVDDSVAGLYDEHGLALKEGPDERCAISVHACVLTGVVTGTTVAVKKRRGISPLGVVFIRRPSLSPLLETTPSTSIA